MSAIYSYVFPQMGSGNYAKYKKHEDFYKDEYEKCVCVCVCVCARTCALSGSLRVISDSLQPHGL